MANRWLFFALLLSAGLLGAWVFAEWRTEPSLNMDVAAEPLESLAEDAPLPEPSEHFTPVSDFKATLARPLFVQGRRPEPDEPDTSQSDARQQTAPPPPAPTLQLSAIIVNDRERSALLLPAGESQSERVREGESVAGWEIIEIRDDAVLIRSGRREETLTLRDFGPPGPIPRRPAANANPQPANPAQGPRTAEQLRALRQRAAQRARQSQGPN